MAVNVKSIVLAAKYAIPQMVKAGGGSIINISSVAGLRANQSTPYSTSKAAVVGLTRSMAGDHGRAGIRVNCILPGLIYGPMTAPRMDEENRGGVVFRAVDAVGVAGDRPDAGGLDAEREQELGTAPAAAAFTFNSHRALAARDQCDRRFPWPSVISDFANERGHHLRHFRR